MESLHVVPVHPPEGRELDGSPGARACGSTDDFGRVVAVDGLGEGIVIAIADGPDRRCRADLSESFAVANGRKLTARIRVTAEILMMTAPRPASHLDRVEDHGGAHV